MDLPKSWTETGNQFLGMRISTDDLIPDCSRCFVIGSTHKKTKERGYLAFCKKSGKMEMIGPYKSYHEALKILTLTKGCDSCNFNKTATKEAYLPMLNEKFKEDMERLYGKDYDLSIAMSPVQHFVEARNYVDVNFKNRFGVALFNAVPDDSVAVVDLIKQCTDQKDFAIKIQALAGMIDRINEKELKNKIKKKEKEKLQGSITVLEQFLIENLPKYPPHVISNLRNLIALRNKIYPTHTTAAEILVILRNFGIDKYPLDDWEAGLRKIVNFCANSLSDLLRSVQS